MSAVIISKETKLKRFLHYASETGLYIVGSRKHPKFFAPKNVESFRRLLKTLTPETIIKIIRKVHDEKTSQFPEIIPFVLAECVRFQCMTKQTYQLAEEICTTSESFLLFVKFAIEIPPKIGTGRAFRRFISNWYLKKDPLQLAESSVKQVSVRGWRHADVIKLAHVRSKEPAKAALFKFHVKGFDAMLASFKDNPEAKRVVDYLTEVHLFRREADETKVISTIETYMLNWEHVNPMHLKSKSVWIALLRQIPLETLLNNFQFLSKNKLFRYNRTMDHTIVNAVRDRLLSNSLISESGLHPSRAYIEWLAYQRLAKYKLTRAEEKHNKPAQTTPQISSELVESLEKLVELCFKSLKPTGRKLFIAIDEQGAAMRTCRHLPFIKVLDAACFISHCLYRTEATVDVVSFSDSEPLKPFDVSRNFKLLTQEVVQTAYLIKCQEEEDDDDDDGDEEEEEPYEDDSEEELEEGEKVSQNRKPHSTHFVPDATLCAKKLSNMLTYATASVPLTDAYILMGCSFNTTQFLDLITNLKKTKRRAKIIVCNFCGSQANADHPDLLVINGFDESTCSIMTSFLKGDF